MSHHTLRARIGFLFFSFFILVILSVGMTFESLRTQEDDAMIINLAGRQRMFTQQMTWMALYQPEAPALFQSMEHFERNLYVLKNGGETLDAFGRSISLPAAPGEEISTLLDQVFASWVDFQSNIYQLQSFSIGTPEYRQYADRLQALSQVTLGQLDEVVSAFEKRAQEKVNRLWVVQAVFLGLAISLLLIGFLFTRRRIVDPLEKLGQVTHRIGTGDLSTAVPQLYRDELGQLADVMESMRVELAASHQTLQSLVEQRTNELVEAFEFSKEIVAQLDLATLLQSVTDRSQKLMNAQQARLCLIRGDEHALELVASQGETIPADKGVYQPLERGIALQVVGEGKTIAHEGNLCASCSFMKGQTLGICLAAPLKTGKTILGALCVVRDEGYPFSGEESQAMTLLANTAAIAITNARLVEQERQQAHQSAVLTERQRLSAELHDHLAQTLSFIRLRIEHARSLVQLDADQVSIELFNIQNKLENAYDQVREAIIGITPRTTETDDLRDQLLRCLKDFEISTSMPIELEMEPEFDYQLSAVQQSQFFHIVRESLTNIHRHAQAKKVVMRVAGNNGNICCVIRDDGCGFDLHQELDVDHLGLKIMHTRATRIGGSLEIRSAPGAGTAVILTIPLFEAVP